LKKQAKFLHYSTLKYKQYYSQVRIRLLRFETVRHSTKLESGTSNLPFASSWTLTTKTCERYVIGFATIIDLFICLEACCYVSSKNMNCNCHLSTIFDLQINKWKWDLMQVDFSYVLCVKFLVVISAAGVGEIVAKERRI
jgi:hypothetical protein